MSWETWSSLDELYPWGTWVSLDDVHRSGAARETVIYGPALVYVVNYDSSFPYPRRFLYSACSKMVGYKRLCSKSLESNTVCHRDGGFVDKYRFNLILIDAVHGCQPLKAQIWDEAFNFLGLPASDFRKCTEAEQIAYVRGLTLQTPKCNVYLQLQEGVASIQSLTLLHPLPNVSFPPSLRRTGYHGGPSEWRTNFPRPSRSGSTVAYYTYTPSDSSSAYYIPTASGSSTAYCVPTRSGSNISYTPTSPVSSHALLTTSLGSSPKCIPTPSDSSIASVASQPRSCTAAPSSRPHTSIADTPTLRKMAGRTMQQQQQLMELLDMLKVTKLDKLPITNELEVDKPGILAHGGSIPARHLVIFNDNNVV